MKKIVLFLIMFLFVGNVYAKEITLDDMVTVINSGVITEEYKEMKLAEKDKNGNNVWTGITIGAVKKNNGIEISYALSGSTIKTGKVNAVLLEDGITLQSKISFKKDDEYKFEHEIEIHDLLVYWAVEASDGFDKIQEYFSDNYIEFFNAIFDKCYREELHSCRTYVSSYGDFEYTSDVELNEGPADYVIEYLKEGERINNNNKMLLIVAGIGVILLILFLLAKSMEKPVKKIKY